nr:MAG TPA: hypothetical protein [Caudoviricetes sp.]
MPIFNCNKPDYTKIIVMKMITAKPLPLIIYLKKN